MASHPVPVVYDAEEAARNSAGSESMFGGAVEGAERLTRETINWVPSTVSPDRAINTVKPMADARGRDMAVNDGYTQGAIRLQKDSIIGAAFRLNAKPDYRVIYGEDSEAAAEYGEELASAAEARFNLAAESEDCWFDAGGSLTFTGLLRLQLGVYLHTGDCLETAEWQDSDPLRPFKTMFQLVAPQRLCNPDGKTDEEFLRRGVEIDKRGKPKAFWIQEGYPHDFYGAAGLKWKRVPARLPWGRRQVIFMRDANLIDQTRGMSEMVAALAHMRMTKKFSEITLQRAVVDATYAAAIESELPNHEVIAAMGGGTDGWMNAIGQYMTMLQQYLGGSENIAIDGVKMPHLFPGTKLNMQNVGAPAGVGSEFEASMLRRIAATLGVSYAEFARDFTKGSYSSAKAEVALAERTASVKKRTCAERIATQRYQLWFEEEMGAGNLPLPPGRNRTDFYRPLMKDAYTRCAWIGTGRGQIDELKETQAAMLRVKAGFSTFEEECAKLGRDYREVFAQRAKENRLQERLGLSFTLDATRDGNNEAGRTISEDDPNEGRDDGD